MTKRNSSKFWRATNTQTSTYPPRSTSLVELDRQSISSLDRRRLIIVDCYDYQ
jgi:hypothetical protein